MKKIFKFISVILVFILLFSLGCNKVNPLYERVSELRLDLFSGKSESFSLSANYGFREEPYLNDGEVGNKIYLLTFHILDDNLDGAEYEISFDYKGQSYQSAFKLNPISHKKTVSFEVENFSEKEFTVTVFGNGKSEAVTLTSILPKNTISYQKALDCLYDEQKELIEFYQDKNGSFNAEINVRILVKNDKPYYYVGIASGNEKLKALLIDGISGKVLAIREIF